MTYLNFICARDCKWLAGTLLAVSLLIVPLCGPAAEISVIGVFPGKGAVIVINGGKPKSLRIGKELDGVTLVSVDKSGAVIEEAGRRRSVALGQHTPGPAATGSRMPQVNLAADDRGHFMALSTVNGAAIRFLVDTGATVISIPGADARRIGLDFLNGQKGVALTANGPVPVYHIKLERVKVGEIELLNVDAMVMDGGGLSQPLLGMSFLNRVEMRRDGDAMTLIRRF